MNRHLTDDEVTRLVAGIDAGPEAAAHLASCVACRRRVEALTAPIAGRRAQLEAGAPDWDAQREAILGRLEPAPAPVVRLNRHRWRRAVLAAAAALVAALGLWLNVGHRAAPTPGRELHVEQILNEVDTTLADESVPGFEALDQLVPSPAQISAMSANGRS